MVLLKDADISKIEAGGWPAVMEKFIINWIDVNREEQKCAEYTIRLVNEYPELKTNC